MKIGPMILLLIIIIVGIIVVYFLIKNSEKYIVPDDYFSGYEFKKEIYLDRDVFILSKKNTLIKEDSWTILYIHGGTYMATMSKDHWDFLKNLVDDLDCTIIVPEYPLIPENNYKDVFAFIQPLYQDIIKEVGTEHFIVMGDSAGGGASLALCQKNGEEGIKQPEKLILISPWLDVTMQNPEIDKVQKYDTELNKVTLKVAGEVYAGKDGIHSYLVNPMIGPLDQLKNVTIFTGTHDILNPDVHILNKRAISENIKINIEETQDAKHIWIVEKNRKPTENTEKDYQRLLEIIKKESE